MTKSWIALPPWKTLSGTRLQPIYLTACSTVVFGPTRSKPVEGEQDARNVNDGIDSANVSPRSPYMNCVVRSPLERIHAVPARVEEVVL